MTVLADTMVVLWSLLDDARLPRKIRAAMRAGGLIWICHQVSLWEIQIKYDVGKLRLPSPPREFLAAAIAAARFTSRPIEDEAIFLLGKLPPLHRDPFDRLLVAHALLHGWPIATTDPNLLRYPVQEFKG